MDLSEHPTFISCDWGTSMLRMSWVRSDSFETIQSFSSSQGIRDTYNAWQKKKGGTDRYTFYAEVLGKVLEHLDRNTELITPGIPIICSGMASSSLGIMELPYAALPFSLEGGDARVSLLEASAVLPNPIFLISGLQSDCDVMRGEETELIGALKLNSDPLPAEFLAILPGTHSKHIQVSLGSITAIHTYMTGEIFTLLKNHSTLGHSLAPSGNTQWSSFREGLAHSLKNPLLSALFQIRVKELLYQADKEGNYYFLSGLLIGSELRSLDEGINHIVLMGNQVLRPLYADALQTLGWQGRLTVLKTNSPLAIQAGQLHLYQTKIKAL